FSPASSCQIGRFQNTPRRQPDSSDIASWICTRDRLSSAIFQGRPHLVPVRESLLYVFSSSSFQQAGRSYSSFAHLAIFDVKLVGAFALVSSFVSAAVSDLGPTLPSGVFAAAMGVSAWVIASAMIRPAPCGSLRTPARSTSPSVVFISFATSVLSSGSGPALTCAGGATLASG